MGRELLLHRQGKLYIPAPFEPETNKDSLDPSGLVSLIRAINGDPNESFLREVSAFLDVEKFLTYVAVENALAEHDGFLGYAGMNNFYLYQYLGQNRFTIIPWDKDASFRQETRDLFQRVGDNVLTRRLLEDRALRESYQNAVLRAVDSFVNATWLSPQLERRTRKSGKPLCLTGTSPLQTRNSSSRCWS